MATALFADFVPEVSPHISGCPDPVTTAYIRKVVIDLCSRAKVWRVTGTSVVATAGVAKGFALVSGVTDTVVSSLISAQMHKTTANTTRKIDIVSSAVAYQRYPDWPNALATGEPVLLFQEDPLTLNVAPVPNTADTYTIIPLVAIKPTSTATVWDSVLAEEFRQLIFHGVLYELMLMPKRHWSDAKTAMIHGKRWQYLLQEARARVRKGFSSAEVSVEMVPWG